MPTLSDIIKILFAYVGTLLYLWSMENQLIKSVLIKNTKSIFSQEWYENVSNEIIKASKQKHKGYVYFAKPTKSNFIKIGMSYDVKERVKSLESNFGAMVLLGFIYDYDYSKLEKKLHNHFKDKNISGEWFELELTEVLEYLKFNNGVIVNKQISQCLIDQGFVLTSKSKNDVSIYSVLKSIPFNQKIQLSDFKEYFDKIKISQNRIISEVEKVALLHNITLTKPRSNGVRFIMLENKK